MSAQYLVVATRLYQLLEDGSEVRHKAGDTISTLSDADVKRHLASGAIAEIRDEDEPLPFDDSGADPGDADLGGGSEGDGQGAALVERPDRDANKPVIVTWIADNVSKDDGTDFTESELNKLNKDELWAIIDGIE